MARHGDIEPSTMPGPPRGPRVFLHIGEPKTGTTFLQQVMWRNRSELAAQGVVLPGHHPQDHYRASQDLRNIPKLASDPAGSWTGEWEILARQAQQAARVAVISHELFSAVDAEQANRAVRSLEPAEVHVVLTVRDMGSLLPAEWQETVKHRNARGWEDWLSDVIDRESVSADRRQWWFWRVHDTLAILDIWSQLVPPEQVHVITTPVRGSDNGLLWERFASLLEVDPAGVDLGLALIENDLGPELAKAVARKLVVYHRRGGGQSQFSTLLELSPKSDRIQAALAYARDNLHSRGCTPQPATVQSGFPRRDRPVAGQGDREPASRGCAQSHGAEPPPDRRGGASDRVQRSRPHAPGVPTRFRATTPGSSTQRTA